MDVTLRRTVSGDIPECGRILYEAFATLADAHGFPRDFPTVEAATGSMRALIGNPGFHGVAAELEGRVVGSTFLDERSTIHAIGPCTSPARGWPWTRTHNALQAASSAGVAIRTE